MDDAPAEHQYARLLPRVKALIFDAAVYVVVIVAALVATPVLPSDALGRIVLMLFVGTLVLYEPLMLWRYGGTLGHMRQNLRVVSDRSGGNPGLIASIVRWWIKGVFGFVSFFLMAVTRRHQALHDRVSSTTVRPRDVTRMREGDFVGARTGPVGATDVSVGRRIAAIVAYEILFFVLLVAVPMPFVSEACYMQNRCTEGEDLMFSAAGLLWMLAAGFTVLLGWKGRLPGARSRAT